MNAKRAGKISLIPDEPLGIIAVNGYHRTGTLLDRTVGRDVIYMAVGIDNILDAETKLLNSIQNNWGVAAGVNDDANLGIFTAYYVAVAL